jgi:hypothetical protein
MAINQPLTLIGPPLAATDLRHVNVGLHHQERVQRVRTAGIRIVKEVLDLCKRRLTETRPKLRLCRLGWCRGESQRFRGMGECAEDASMQSLHLLQPSGCKWTLGR